MKRDPKDPCQISTCSRCGKPVMSNESRRGYDHDICPGDDKLRGDKFRVCDVWRHGVGAKAARE